MTSEFQRKMQETKDKLQEGLSEFQRKMQEKQEFGLARTMVRNNTGKGNVINAKVFNLDLAANPDDLGWYSVRTKVASR